MSYSLNWEAPCFEEVDALVAAGMPREPIREAVRQIDNELQTEPENKGHALSEGLRRLDIPPFRAYFHVDTANRVVNISLLHFQPNP